MDALHQIIKSLNPHEKRYFNVFGAAFKNDSGLLQLFKVMEGQEKYNEAEIKEKAGITNIAEKKSQLRKLILKAMRNYREADSIKTQLRNTMEELDFLISKGLYEEARKEIHKAMKSAEHFEEWGFMAEMLSMLYEIASLTQKHDKHTEKFEELHELIGQLQARQLEISRAVLFQRQINIRQLQAQNESPEAHKAYFRETSALLGERIKQTESLYARVVMLQCIAFFQASLKPANECISHFEEIAEIYKQNPALIEVSPSNYLSFLNSYGILAAYNAGLKETALAVINEIERSCEALKGNFKNMPEKLRSYLVRLTTKKLTYEKINREWNRWPGLEEEVRNNVLQAQLKEKVITALQTSSLISNYLVQGNFDKVIEWVAVYYSQEDANTLKPLMICVRAMEAGAYYGLKQYDVSQSKCINLYKTFIEKEFTDPFHKQLGTMLRRLNSWDLTSDKDKREVENLAEGFKELRAGQNIYYMMYKDVFDPMDILLPILAKVHA